MVNQKVHIMTTLTMNYVLTPAYGRDYRSKKALLADFNADKDFMAHCPSGMGYINKSQIEEEKLGEIQVRYNKNRNVAIITFNNKKGEWI